MKPQGRALIAVGVFAALLVAVLLTRDRGSVNVGVARLELPAVDAAQVTRVEVSGAQTVSLKKEAAGWTVADGTKAFHPADLVQVTGMLDQLKGLKAGDFVTERAEKLAEYDLDETKGLAVRVFTTGAAPALEVVFGKPAKSGGSYLRSPKSNQSFVTHSGLAWAVRKDANGWRKRGFFPAKLDQLTGLTVKPAEGEAVALQKNSEGKWTLGSAAPAGFRFDPTLAERLAVAVVSVSAVDFLDTVGADPFSGPHATVEAQLKEGAQLVLHLGAAQPAVTGAAPKPAGVAARVDGDPQVYLVGEDAAATLKAGLAGLRDLSLLAFNATKATRLTVTAAGKKTVVAKDGASWKLVEPKAAPAGFEFEPSQVMSQLAALQSMKATRIAEGVTDAQAGLAKATTRVDLAIEGGPPQAVVFGAEAADKQLYVKGSADALVYLIDPSARAHWEGGVELFKKPPPPPPNQQIRGLEDLPPEVRAQLEAQLRQRAH